MLSDNGPFSLHPTSYLDEDVKLAEEIDYLREANAKPYYGPLDDDPMDHVDAFWGASSSSAVRARTRRP